MKKQQFIALIITAVMIIALPMSVSAASDLIPIQYTYLVAPDGVEQGVNNTAIVMSFEGKEKFEENCVFKTFAGNEDGIYEFVTLDDGAQCLKLGYNKNQYWSNFRVMPTFKEVGYITTEYKYARITYMTTDTEHAAIRLTNNANHNDNAVFTSDASVSGGEWVVSDVTFVGGGDLIKRYLNGTAQHCTIEYTAESPESALYIKELVFFKTEEDALKYYGDNTEEEPEQKPNENLPAPVIMSFEGNENFSKNSMFKTFAGNEDGIYEFVTLSDGTQCLKLMHNPNMYWANYRVMPTFKYAGTVNDAYKYVRITYMTEDTFPASIRVTNNANHSDSVILVPDASASNGEWKISNAAFIAGGDMIKRWSRGEALHCTIEYTSEIASSALYIKELAFFATEEQAYSYYGDTKQAEVSKVYSVMSFGENGNASVNNDNASFGTNSLNTATGAIDIVHGTGNFYGIKYMAKLRFDKKDCVNAGENYVRVLYSAENPEGTTGASLFMLNDGSKELIELVKNVPNTNGEFVLSDTVYFPNNIITRLAGSNGNPLHVSFCSTAANPGGTYSIKAVFFFPSRASADAFEYSASDSVNLTIDQNDISNYRIVIPADGDRFVTAAADMIVKRVKAVCGIELPVVTDDTAATAYEIILGHCSRPESESYYQKAVASGDNVRYELGVENGKLIINAVEHLAVRDGAQMLAENYIYASGLTAMDINIDEKFNHSGVGNVLVSNNIWHDAQNIEDPYVLTDDFSEDMKYFTEDGGADNTKVENGVLTLTSEKSATAYIHVYESNVRFDAKMKYTDTSAYGKLGLTLRYNAVDAYVRGGFDNETGEWFIEFREGTDFGARRIASKKYALAPDTWYDVAMTADGSQVTIEVNGETVLSADGVDHITPGRVGIFAENASIVLDEMKVTLLSGEGTVIRGVEHTLLPDEELREGGSVIEMADGTLHYETHYNNAAFRSIDGKTWTRTDSYFKVSTYPQILRLNNGDLLNIVLTKVDGVEVRLARLSSDDGKTWRDGGVVCPHNYNGVNSLNMNDKVTQSATTGRIFYSQNYDGNWTVNGTALKVFCVFFYSDDNGLTWHESETGSWEIPGNEKEIRFGESKIIQCADGTLRMYNSWNAYPCIVYSESADNGVTWGPIQKMPSFVCTTSSMQIVRDPYADNDTTYYMVWVNCDLARSRLSLAKTEDGKNWSYIGDIWRWECAYKLGQTGFPMAHIVDPFISVSRDKIIAGAGIPEHVPEEGPVLSGHGELRQHIWTIDRDTLGEGKPINVFTDMDMGAPYYEAVSYVYNRKLFQGVSETEFAPDTSMSRAMFVTVLGRLEGVDTASYTGVSFTDIDTVYGTWYAPYVEWAAANGIGNGIGNVLYGVNDNVTVQQACVILARYANYRTADTSTGITLADYPDSGEVASWAKAEMEWALANGIYDGMNGKLAPNAPASRALVATMFYNYVNNIK